MALILLDGRSRVALLSLIWAAALGGLFFRMFWLGAPRWLYTALYLVMGWAALGWLGAFYRSGGAAVLILILAGGVYYSPGPSSTDASGRIRHRAWFGFHEIFHAGTIAGFVCHYIAISLIIYRAS